MLQNFLIQIYQLMQIKGRSSQTTPSKSNKSAFSRYNLCFTYSNTKKSHSVDRKAQKQINSMPINHFAKVSTQSVQMPSSFKTSYSLHTHVKSTTFYPSRRQSWSMLPQQKAEEKNQIQYIPHPFPQRRHKSGENQLIKLLLKYSNVNRQQEINKNPLFMDNNETNRGIIPKVKNFSRLNWKKDRYRVNRDREHGIIREEQGFDTRQQTQCDQNSKFLRASLLPKKLF